MAQTNISFEMSEKLKDQMEQLCEDLDLTMEEAFQIFAAKMVNEQVMPCEVTEYDYPPKEGCLLCKALGIGAAVAAVIALAGAIAAVVNWLKKR